MYKPRIFLCAPHMSGLELEFVRGAFESNYIAPLGPMVDAFEMEFAKLIGTSSALALSNETAAMHLALLEAGVKPDDEVLVSTLIFVGSVNPILLVGAVPSFIDINEASWNIDLNLLSKELDKRSKCGNLPKALITNDIYGLCVDLKKVRKICEPYNIAIISDSTESVGSFYDNKHAGVEADIAIYSFNGNKIITTSGGAILSANKPDMVEHARYLSQVARDPAPHYEHSEIGYSYRMSNVLAAIGRGQLRILDERLKKKRFIYEQYKKQLSNIAGISFMPEIPNKRVNHWITVIMVDPIIYGASREDIRLALQGENIESRPIWKPMHLQPVFNGVKVCGGAVAEYLFEKGLCLPSGTQMTQKDIERICEIIINCRN